MINVSDCSVRGPRFDSHHGQLCLSWRPLRYTALGIGCTHLLQCLAWLSLTLCGMVKWVLAFGLSNNKMAMMDLDGSCLPADSQPKLVGLVCGLAAIWHWVCIYQVNRVNSRWAMMTALNIIICVIVVIIISLQEYGKMSVSVHDEYPHPILL